MTELALFGLGVLAWAAVLVGSVALVAAVYAIRGWWEE
ncbi:membrane protein [Arthrobacter phage Amyev]|uniref:Membrane protein n=1 Tax=Arthrobacter phage Amyev TaxID=2832315 RepID=A0AA48Y3U5_9CAUD|nr:membrane protein [Arthrobacter phage Amyev]UIW13480.1 membrane protein [Arthrobacter phage Amyev]